MPTSRAHLPPDPEKAHAKPWIIERMLSRAQPHLTESRDRPVGRWLILGTVLLFLLACAALLVWLRGTSEVGSAAATPISSPAAQPSPVQSWPAGLPTPLSGQTAVVPTPTLTRSPSPVPTPTLVQYRVQVGDTLSGIAQRYGVSVDAIMRANGLKNETIYAGQLLTIPRP